MDNLRQAVEGIFQGKFFVGSSNSAAMSMLPEGRPTPQVSALPDLTLPSEADTSKSVVMLDGIDLLLASQPSLSTISLQSFISKILTRSHALITTCNADAPLMRAATTSSCGSGTPLERNHTHFLTSMAHQSQWVFQLRGLDTGGAKDVSGVVRVSRGGAWEDEDQLSGMNTSNPRSGDNLADAEWLYQLKGDGSVRVWGRGE